VPPSSPLAVDAFELVNAPGGARLLRLAGRWPGPTPDLAALAVCRDGAEETLPPLPGPPGTNGVWSAAWALPAGVDPRVATFALVLADGARIDLPRPGARQLGDPLRKERMRALVDAYAVARREREAAVRAARSSEAARAQAAERARRAEQGERDQRTLAGEARTALARAHMALDAAERRARDAEQGLAAARSDLARRAAAQRKVEAQLAAALEAGARAERLDAELSAVHSRLSQVESAAAAEREELHGRLETAVQLLALAHRGVLDLRES